MRTPDAWTNESRTIALTDDQLGYLGSFARDRLKESLATPLYAVDKFERIVSTDQLLEWAEAMPEAYDAKAEILALLRDPEG